MDSIIKELFLKRLQYNPDNGNFYWLNGVRKGQVAGCINKHGYVQIRLGDKLYKAHRIAFLFMGQTIPSQVDHINRIKHDNRWCNLRPCNASNNQHNQGISKNNTSGYKGVGWHSNRNKWYARVYLGGKCVYMRYFETPQLAHKAYCKAVDKYHGDFKNYGT